MTVPIGTRLKAGKLFVIEGKTLAEVSGMTGISERTLANWCSRGGWVKRRLKYHQSLEDIDKNIFVIYAGITRRAAESLSAQDIDRVLQLEKILSKKKGG